MPSVIRIIPKRDSASTQLFRHPSESLWGTTAEGELAVTSFITGRVGSWHSSFNTELLDSPPIVAVTDASMISQEIEPVE